MFEEKLDELYTELANIINEMIPVDWKKIYYLGEVEEGKLSWNSIFYFIDENGEIVRSLDIPDKYNISEEEYFELEEESQTIMLDI
ncbi:MAG: antitoxin YezG family protein, partial [Lachnospiraceae bacterium]|nr:antitoxin YezG family protein [Lachnospiraceae bacterium]